MKIALLGYGKMGHEIEKIAVELGYSVDVTIDNENDWIVKAEKLKTCDVAIEFSVPTVSVENMRRCFGIKLPVVVGTTGWHDQLPAITELCKTSEGTLFYSSNFSVGVNIFFEINRRLAKLLRNYPMYLPSMTEIHHTQKLDAPSGTAISLANDILSGNSRFNRIINTEHAGEGEIPVKSVREGSVTGTHTVMWKSDIDQISITHEAFNRRGFAMGAVMAASWIIGRKGIYTMNDMLDL